MSGRKENRHNDHYEGFLIVCLVITAIGALAKVARVILRLVGVLP